MAKLKDVLAQKKEEGTARDVASSAAVLAAIFGKGRRRQGSRVHSSMSTG
jgi:hypothetical protein